MANGNSIFRNKFILRKYNILSLNRNKCAFVNLAIRLFEKSKNPTI